MEKEKILERWSEYNSELHHDERGVKPPIMKYFDGLKAVKSMKKGTASMASYVTSFASPARFNSCFLFTL